MKLTKHFLPGVADIGNDGIGQNSLGGGNPSYGFVSESVVGALSASGRADATRPQLRSLKFLSLICVFLMLGSSLFAGNIKIKAQNEPLKKVLEQITEQTGYEFAYSNAVNPDKIIVNADAYGKEATVFFNEFFPKIGLSYKIVGKAVSLSLKQPEQQNQDTSSEKIKITGKVVDGNGEPLPGVYIAIIDTKAGATTDIDGNYSIDCKIGQKLRFSFLGFKDLERTVTKSLNSFKNVVMEEDAVALESTVVIGYGNTQKIKDVTGSISHVGAKEIQQAAMGSNITSLLQGRAAGVNVQMQSASPTSPVSVVVRGMSSISGNNQPLWIIDGIPEYNDGVDGNVSNVLYSLNLNDVESIDILKDASSTAIYGSRAANGVIIVTTKSGKEGMKPTLEVSAKVGIQFQDFNSYDYFSAKDYIAFTREAVREDVFASGVWSSGVENFLDKQAFLNMNTSEFKKSDLKDMAGAYYLNNDTDWVDLMTQNPIQQQYDATLRGGHKAVSYLASVSYRDNQGIVRTGYNKMFSGRLRLEARVSDAIKLRFNASGSTRNASNKDGMMSMIKKVRPDMPVYNEDGSIYNKDSSTENPYTLLANKNTSTGENLAANMEIEYKFLNDFMFTSKGSLNYANSESLTYNNSKYYATGSPALASRTWSRPKSDTKVWDNTLLYTKVIGKHDISASLTASMEKYQSLYYSMSATGFPDDEKLNSFTNAITKSNMSETYVARTLMSQLARIQYNYDSKYLATFTIRRDGSSRFGKDRRWGWFPSFGLGWTVTNEKFFKDWDIEDILSFLKVRFSYGKSGSQNLADYKWLTMVDSNMYNDAAGVYPSSLGNDELSWEETIMTDVALEMEFWKSRIRASVGYFKKDANDLIFTSTVPGSSGFTTITTNIGSTTTKGIEFSFDIDIVKNSKWQLTYSLNGASNTTYVNKFREQGLDTYVGAHTQVEVGQKVGQWYGYKTYHRLFGSNEEVTALKIRKENGDIDYYRSYSNYEGAGDVYIMDINGDGKVNSEDQTYIGSQIPKLYGGMGLQLYIGTNFNIGATFSYSIGNKRFWNMPASDVGYTKEFNQSNKVAGMSAVLSKNSPYNNTTMPRATFSGIGRNNLFSDYWLYDASYIRLNALNVSYRLDKRYFGNTILDNIEFTFQASNLFTLTRYPGFDPQGNFSAETTLISEMGVDSSIYPSARTFTAGVKITFK